MPPPAASTAALMFSHTCRVCASMSPMPAIEPSARRAVMPEMNTSLPFASTVVACEKCPLGWRILSLLICRFIQPLSLERRVSARILVIGVPGRPARIMRSVVDLDHDRLLVRQGRPVHVALRIPVERAGGQRDAGFGVFISALEAEHELVRRVQMRLGNARALIEPDERNGRPAR